MSTAAATKLYIGNLPDQPVKEDLELMFRKFGNVVEFDIVRNYGFVHYELESEAKAACAALDGQVHRGTNIKVEISRSTVRQKAGMGGNGECYRCGDGGHWSKECPRGPSQKYRGQGRGRREDRGSRYSPYDRKDPYHPDAYDYYASRLYAAAAYDRYRYDPYERSLPPPPPRDFYARDPYDRPAPDYYRRAAAHEAYYDYYERRLAAANAASAASAPEEVRKPQRPAISARVPGPY